MALCAAWGVREYSARKLKGAQTSGLPGIESVCVAKVKIQRLLLLLAKQPGHERVCKYGKGKQLRVLNPELRNKVIQSH